MASKDLNNLCATVLASFGIKNNLHGVREMRRRLNFGNEPNT
jgi:hypothetical protein